MVKQPLRILIVDDSPLVIKQLVTILSPLGHKLEVAANGQEALAKVRQHPPDLVITDVVMPVMDGIELCRHLKNDPVTRLIPVVIHSSLKSVTDRVQALEAGADDFLNKPVDASELLARTRSLLTLKQHIDALEHAEKVLAALAKGIEARDSYTRGHCERMADYAVLIGERLNLRVSEKKVLALGGMMHDIGKVAIPDSILLKPGRLTPEERQVIEQHPLAGYEICKEMVSLRAIAEIVRWHHEKLDGSGYPDGLRGDQIPLPAQIMAVCDVYDALSTKRSYKESLPLEKCREILCAEADRGWWNRAVVDTLFTLVGPDAVKVEYPYLAWKEDYSVHIGEIDLQHRHLVDLINRLSGRLAAGHSREELAGILAELLAYAENHFAWEEKHMARDNSPEALLHREEHASFRRRTAGMRDDLAQQRQLLTVEVLDYVRDWLLSHIMVTDKTLKHDRPITH